MGRQCRRRRFVQGSHKSEIRGKQGFSASIRGKHSNLGTGKTVIGQMSKSKTLARLVCGVVLLLSLDTSKDLEGKFTKESNDQKNALGQSTTALFDTNWLSRLPLGKAACLVMKEYSGHQIISVQVCGVSPAGTSAAPPQLGPAAGCVECLKDLTSSAELKASSRQAMINSLTGR